MQKRALPALLALALAIGGCVSAGAGRSPGAFVEEIGPAIVPAVEREAMPILQRFGYAVQRTERTQDRITIESNWVNRQPFAEEEAAGVRDVRTRVVIATRPRSTTNSAGSTVSAVTLRVEVEHLSSGSDMWRPATIRAADMASVVRRLAEAFRLEFQVRGLEG
jgi:hypothetical protein